MAILNRVIRRRLLLGGLVVVSLAMLTAYYREPVSGPLHGTQTSISDVAVPFEQAAQRVAQPFRDAWSWTTGLIHAKSRADRLQRQLDAVLARNASLVQAQSDGAEYGALYRFWQDSHFGSDPVFAGSLGAGWNALGAHVTERPTTVGSSTVEIDRGSTDGLRLYDPVVAGHGWLVGEITQLGSHSAEVMLLDDPRMKVSALLPQRHAVGLIAASPGNPGTLQLQDIGTSKLVRQGDWVTTAGSVGGDSALPSHFPRGLVIGLVSSESQSESDLFKQIQVTPQADLGSFSAVLVLTPKHRAALP